MEDWDRLLDREQRLAKIRELLGSAKFEQNRDLLEEADAVQEAALFVRQMREHADLTQSALAEKLGVSQPRISQIERGNSPEGISYSLIRRVATACGFSHWPISPLESLQAVLADADEESPEHAGENEGYPHHAHRGLGIFQPVLLQRSYYSPLSGARTEQKQKSTISHLYNDYPSAKAAARELQAAGLDDGDISIVASNADNWYKNDRSDVTHVDIDHDKDRDGVDDSKEGAAKSATIGGVVAGAAGLAAGLGLLAIPGIGPIVAAGWAVSTLAGVVAGDVTGVVVGALVESGVSKDDADVYAEAIRRGGALVVARVNDSDVGRYQAVLDRSGYNATTRATKAAKSYHEKFTLKTESKRVRNKTKLHVKPPLRGHS